MGRGRQWSAAAPSPSWCGPTLRKQPRGELNGLDDFHVAGAPADIAAERGTDFFGARAWIATQEARTGHDKTRCAVAALRAELLVKAALNGRQGARLS